MELQIDRAAVERCRGLAANIADPVASFIGRHSTVSVERSVLRLCGVDGVDPKGVPLANRIVDAIGSRRLESGAALSFGRVLAKSQLEPRVAGERLAAGTLTLDACDDVPEAAARRAVSEKARAAIERIVSRREERRDLIGRLPQLPPPLLYVI